MRLIKNLYFYPEKGMMDCNTYVIKDKTSVIIDPGLTQFLPELLQDLHQDGIDPKEIDIIANTHLHGDHCWSNGRLRKSPGLRYFSIRHKGIPGRQRLPRHQGSSAFPPWSSPRMIYLRMTS